MYCVIVTYGNAIPHARYASAIKTEADAEALRAAAVEKGYTDAAIWNEKEFRAFLQARQAAKGRPKKGSR